MARLEGEAAPLKTAATKYEAERSAWARERAFLAAGVVDAEAQDIAALFHGRIPEADRPDLGAWLATLKADPTKAPRALAPYLAPSTPQAPPGAPPTNVAPPSPPPAPVAPPVRSVQTTPTAPGVVTAEAIRAATQRAQQSGKWDEVTALTAQVNAELAAKRGRA